MSIKEALWAGDLGTAVDRLFVDFSESRFLLNLLKKFENEDATFIIAQTGHRIMDAGLTLWTVGLGASAAKGALEETNDGAWGTVASFFTVGVSGAIVGGTTGALNYVLGTVKTVASGIYLAGVFFAYVVPLMPMLY